MVFCEDCKYLHRTYTLDSCKFHCKKENIIKNTFLRSHIEHPLAEERNKNNDCKDYEKKEIKKEIKAEIQTNNSKRKWWKFGEK